MAGLTKDDICTLRATYITKGISISARKNLKIFIGGLYLGGGNVVNTLLLLVYLFGRTAV